MIEGDPTIKREREENLTWGEGEPIKENHSKIADCTNRECKYNNSIKTLAELRAKVVGVKLAPYSGRGMTNMLFLENVQNVLL